MQNVRKRCHRARMTDAAFFIRGFEFAQAAVKAPARHQRGTYKLPSGYPQATLKPHQCDIKATSKRVDSQVIGTPKPPQGYLKATLRLQQSHHKGLGKARSAC